MAKKQRITILHISDPHYGKLADDADYEHEWKDTNGFVKSCFDALQKEKIKPELVIICGDLVCDGSSPTQYTKAASNIIELCQNLDFQHPYDWARLLVVPGNHEVDRFEDNKNKRLEKYVRYFLENVYANADEATKRARIPPYDISPDTGKSEHPWRRIVGIDGFPVEFILLYSPITDESLLLPKKFAEALKALPPPKDDKEKKTRNEIIWELDRGLIPTPQLDVIKAELKPLEDQRSVLRIALLHHNIMPIRRQYREVGELIMPDLHILSNGVEVLEHLIDKNVALVLHGHRHTQAHGLYSRKDTTKRAVIVGAPTAGLNQKKVEEQLGFNVIDIVKTNISWRVGVRTFLYKTDPNTGQKSFGWNKEISQEDLQKTEEPYKLLSSKEAIKSLASRMVSSQNGPTILHFTAEADWLGENTSDISPSGPGSPFERVWGPVSSSEDIAKSLMRIVSGEREPSPTAIRQFQELFGKSLAVGYLNQDLIKTLRAERRQFSSTNMQDHQKDDAFFKHIQDNVYKWSDKGGLERKANYAIELFRLATDPQFVVAKCVHICPTRSTKYGEEWRKVARIKFAWLVNSALACRGMTNCQLSWMPFCFLEDFDQTLVSIDNGTPRDIGDKRRNPSSIMVGWGPGNEMNKPIDPELTDTDNYSVIDWDERFREQYLHLLGDLACDIRGFLESVIHPLSQRLIHDFPVLRDGTVFMGNLRCIAASCDSMQVYEEARKFLADAHVFVTEECIITVSQLRRLFTWILNQKMIESLRNSGRVLPWLEKDRNTIEERCRGLM